MIGVNVKKKSEEGAGSGSSPESGSANHTPPCAGKESGDRKTMKELLKETTGKLMELGVTDFEADMIGVNVKKKSEEGAGSGSSPESGSANHTPPCAGKESGDRKTMKELLKETTGKLMELGVTLVTNVYGVRMPPIPVFRYDVAVVAYNAKRSFELTKQTRDE
ncbi:hypothetical protein Tcan_16149 [Toxocara canis]|uniref:Uncharacterized protein n=1 Tax=Toxocara canis TaxID=6265 RepID=A0A0B2VTF3_TOXCA|nr:hypothetical protein Tcan_16149 [Toxocara canis]